MKYLIAALSFLTILPVPQPEKNLDYSRAVKFFPVVGSVIGLICASTAALALWLFPSDTLTATIITLLIMTALSGGLHMDGLADTFDGFLSARPRERKLEIMKDSHIGTMGVLGIVFVLLLKVSLLFSLSSSPVLMVSVAFLMPFVGRVSQVFSMSLLPYARDVGLASSMWESSEARSRPALLALVVVSFVVTVVCPATSWWHGICLVLWTIMVVLIFTRWCDRVIEGGTGDTLGAGTEIAELSTALFFAVMI